MRMPDAERAELDRALDDLVQYLRSLGERHWAGWFSDAADHVRAGDDRAAVARVVDAYGGMGSFSDLVFITEDPDAIGKEETERILQLSARVYRIAARHHNLFSWE